MGRENDEHESKPMALFWNNEVGKERETRGKHQSNFYFLSSDPI